MINIIPGKSYNFYLKRNQNNTQNKTNSNKLKNSHKDYFLNKVKNFWFGFFDWGHINFRVLFNTKTILIEGQ